MKLSLKDTPIAIIGMASIFSEARNLQEYWQNILQRKDCTKAVPKSRWDIDDYYSPDPGGEEKTFSKTGGFIPDIEFDPTEFGLPPNLLEVTDVHQFLMLRLAKQALKDAGYNDLNAFDRNKTGVILGVGGGQKLVTPLIARLQYPIWEKVLINCGISKDEAKIITKKIKAAYIPWEENSFPGLLGNIIAGRIANKLDLGGTSCVVDAACASSLAALRMAVSELVERRCDTMITGGVDTDSTIFMYMSFTKTPALSKKGVCAAFDNSADGMLIGEGAGTIILKRLEDAKRDGNRIYAIIKGIGTSSDGKGKSIYAPSIEGQKIAIDRAHDEAGFSPASIGLIEAHGTGTRVGDQTEATSLNDYFLEHKACPKSIAVGSVKSQIGHTKSAAGIAGVIKAALAIYHKILPPTINVQKPLPQFTEENSPIYVNTETRPWIKTKESLPRRAGISAFGFGGTNYHTVLEENEYDHKEAYQLQTGPSILVLCNSTIEGLISSGQTMLENLMTKDGERHFQKWINDFEKTKLPDDWARVGFVASSQNEIIKKLQLALDILKSNSGETNWQQAGICYRAKTLHLKNKNIVACFSGESTLQLNALLSVSVKYPEFREALGLMDHCLLEQGEKSISKILYPNPVFNADDQVQQSNILLDCRYAIPAVGALNMGLFNLGNKFDIKPAYFVSNNVLGDLTAMWAAKMISEIDYCRLLIARGEQEFGIITANDFLEILKKCLIVEPTIPVYSSTINVAITPKNSSTILEKPIKNTEDLSAPIKDIFAKGGDLFIEYNITKPQLSALIATILQDKNHYVVNLLDGIYIKNDDDFQFTETLMKLKVEANLNVRNNPYKDQKDIEQKHKMSAAAVTLNGNNYVSQKRKQSFAELLNDGFTVARNATPISTNSNSLTSKEDDDMKLKMQSNIDDNTVKIYERILQNNESIVKQIEHVQQNINNTMQIYLQNQQETVKSLTKLISDQYDSLMENNTSKTKPPFEQITAVTEKKEHLSSLSLPQKKNSFVKQITETTTIAPLAQEKKIGKANNVKSLSADMLKVVSEKTGYPEEMLNLKMDMEADLGIDSIKRVEILSAMQESHPNMPQVDQSVLVELKTLQEVVDYMESLLNNENLSRETQNSNTSIQEQENVAVTHLAADMLKVVSEKTGYPEEMLNLKMDMESDLGIDSIKRVEILSAMQESHPNMPQVDQSVLVELKTLQEVVDYMESLLNNENLSRETQNSNTSIQEQENVAVTHLAADMLKVVSEKTGYPEEMLNLKMDMESDLGIDSIKRVEILSAMQESHPNMPQVDQSVLVELKTLQEVVDYMENLLNSKRETSAFSTETVKESQLPKDSNICRMTTRLSVLPEPDFMELNIPKDHCVLIVYSNDTLLGKELIEKLQKEKFNVATIQLPTISTKKIQENQKKCSDDILLPDLEEATIQDALKNIFSTKGKISGLIYIHPKSNISKGQKNTSFTSFNFSQIEVQQIEALFLLAKHLSGHFSQTDSNDNFFITVTQTDGQLGLSGTRSGSLSNAIYALTKTLNKEWTNVKCRAIDIDPKLANIKAIENILSELHNPDRNIIEVAYNQNDRLTLATTKKAIAQFNSEPVLNEQDTLLVTGGARGVTSDCIKELAKRFHCNFILLGRTDTSVPEPEWAVNCHNEQELKKNILTNKLARTPKEADEIYKNLIAKREIKSFVEEIKQYATNVIYLSADVTQLEDLKAKLEQVIKKVPQITGIIHGAGVLSDNLIHKKTLLEFRSVFSTKVNGLENLLKYVSPQQLKIILLFSSVASYYGNSGQSDYAMANAVLDESAYALQILHPNIRVITVNWGPWDGGMVTPDLKKIFLKQGIGLIPKQVGALMLYDEIQAKQNDVQVIIGSEIS